MNRFRSVIPLVFVFLSIPGIALGRQEDVDTSSSTEKQVITSDEIAAAGLRRLSDLFDLIDGWYAVSLNGYHYRVSANGLAPTQSPEWMLMVDGHEVDISVLGVQNINLMPIQISQISRVEITSRPLYRDGIVATAGLIHLFTKEQPVGLVASAGISMGNEIDDPGPFRYTDRVTPNIDRIGPTASFRLGYAGQSWFINAGLMVDEHHATDQQIHQRVWSMYSGVFKPRLLMTSPGLHAGIRTRHGQLDVRAGRTELKDLLFLGPYGREIPAIQHLQYAGLSADIFPRARAGIRFDVHYKRHMMNHRQNRRDLFLDWQQDQVHGKIEGRLSHSWLTANLSGRYDRYETKTSFELTDPSLTVQGASFNLVANPLPAWHQTLTFDVVQINNQKLFKRMMQTNIALTERQILVFNLSSFERSAAEENSLWFWTGQGYDIFERDSLMFDEKVDKKPTDIKTADVTWSLNPVEQFGFSISGSIRQSNRQHLAQYLFTYRPGYVAFNTETSIVPNVHGWVTGASIDLRHKLGNALSYRFNYTFHRSFSDDPVYQAAWINIPWHRIGCSIWYKPNPRFSVYGRARFVSSTEWPDYKMVAVTSGNKYPARLPAFFLFDLSISKKLWYEYLSVNLSFKNILNTPYRSHPGGVFDHLMFYFSIQAYFGK